MLSATTKTYAIRIGIAFASSLILWFLQVMAYENGFHSFAWLAIPAWFALVFVVLFLNHNYMLDAKAWVLNSLNWLLSVLMVFIGVIQLSKHGMYDLNCLPSFAFIVSLAVIIKAVSSQAIQQQNNQ